MKQRVTTVWTGNMGFTSKVSGHDLVLDASEDVGGNDQGPRPKEILLSAIAGCSGMDIVSILEKMKVEINKFNIHVVVDITEEHPKHFTSMNIVYEFHGKNLPPEKLQKAVSLSQDKYCGVSYMFRKAFDIHYEIKIVNT